MTDEKRPDETAELLKQLVAQGDRQERTLDMLAAVVAHVTGNGDRLLTEDKAQAAKFQTTDQDIHRAREHNSRTLKHFIRLDEGGEWREHNPGDERAIRAFAAAEGIDGSALDRVEDVLSTDNDAGNRIAGSKMRAHTSPILGRGGVEIDGKPRGTEVFIAWSLRSVGRPGQPFHRMRLHGITSETRRVIYDPAYPTNPSDLKSPVRERITQRAGGGAGKYTGEFEWIELKDADRYEGGREALQKRFGRKGCGWAPMIEPIVTRNKDGKNIFADPNKDDPDAPKVPPPVPLHEKHYVRM